LLEALSGSARNSDLLERLFSVFVPRSALSFFLGGVFAVRLMILLRKAMGDFEPRNLRLRGDSNFCVFQILLFLWFFFWCLGGVSPGWTSLQVLLRVPHPLLPVLAASAFPPQGEGVPRSR